MKNPSLLSNPNNPQWNLTEFRIQLLLMNVSRIMCGILLTFLKY